MPIDPSFQQQIQTYADNLANSLLNAARTTNNGPLALTYGKQANEWIPQQVTQILSDADKYGFGADMLPTIKAYLENRGSGYAGQAYNELLASKSAQYDANQKLQAFRNQLQDQIFGGANVPLDQALTNQNSIIGQLNKGLTDIQDETFRRDMAPVINMALGARGLMDSGANVEIQAKALGQLESQKQSQLLDYALGSKDAINNIQRSDILGDIGTSQATLQSLYGIQRMGVTMEYQRQLERERAELAKSLSDMRGSDALGGLLGPLGSLGGMALGGMIGGPFGAMAGGTLGGALGGYFGGNASQGAGTGMGMGMAGSNFFTPSKKVQPNAWGGA